MAEVRTSARPEEQQGQQESGAAGSQDPTPERGSRTPAPPAGGVRTAEPYDPWAEEEEEQQPTSSAASARRPLRRSVEVGLPPLRSVGPAPRSLTTRGPWRWMTRVSQGRSRRAVGVGLPQALRPGSAGGAVAEQWESDSRPLCGHARAVRSSGAKGPSSSSTTRCSSTPPRGAEPGCTRSSSYS